MRVLHLKAALAGTSHSLDPAHRRFLTGGAVGAMLAGVAAYRWLVERFQDPMEAVAAGAALTMLLASGILLLTCLDIAVARRRDTESENAHLLRRESDLFNESNYDGLTGLPNRRLLEDRFRIAVHRARRNRQSFGFYRVHLPEFDFVGQGVFDAADDRYLVAVANRLGNAVRSSDTLIRIGRGEFVLIVESISNPQELSVVTDKLLKAVGVRPNPGDTETAGGRHSLGLALFPNHGEQVGDMLSTAKKSPCHRHNMVGMLAGLNTYEWGQFWATCEHL